MRAGQSELGKAGVIEARNLPAVRGVTGFARSREPGGPMIENTVLLKIASVATDALRAESHIAPDRRSGMAGIAGKPGVRPQ